MPTRPFSPIPTSMPLSSRPRRASIGEQAQQAAAAGKHVFVEKPFTLTADVARETLAAAKKAGIVLAVGFNRRFHPSMTELRNRVRDGRLGIIDRMSLFEQDGRGRSAIRRRMARQWSNRKSRPAR